MTIDHLSYATLNIYAIDTVIVKYDAKFII